jgi:Family of unknown function (DUF5695)
MMSASVRLLAAFVALGLFLPGARIPAAVPDSLLPGRQREAIVDPFFTLALSNAGIESLRRTGGAYGTEYILPGRSLGRLILRYRLGSGPWQEISTGSPGMKSLGRSEKGTGIYLYAISQTVMFKGRAQLEIGHLLTLQGDSLSWLIRLRNMADSTLEIGDLAIPLPFNNQYTGSGTEIFEKRVIRHHYIGGPASFLYWMRPNGTGPYLVMTPKKGTGLEYYNLEEQGKEMPALFSVYVHSGKSGLEETRGTWRLRHTSLKLSPRKERLSEATYGFTFRWAADFNGVREVLYRNGLVDVRVVPGMTVPNDLVARIAIRTRQTIQALEAEYPSETRITPAGIREENIALYDIAFSHLGENLLTLRYGEGESMPLEFFVTEPLEVLIKKRASFLVSNQQHRERDRWYNGLFSQWDMREGVLRGPDNPDGFLGWWGYVLACDDPALCKAPFLALKNVRYPNRREIKALEYYINNYVWGRLQYTEKDTPYPYGIFGVPNWYENRNKRDGVKEKGEGLHHVWRTYDYPHLVMLYFHMYQIAKMYPELAGNTDRFRYLERAYGTARAMFTVPEMIFPVHEAIKWASCNELVLVEVIDSLEAEGFHHEAGLLREEWEKKVKYFLYDNPYPYRSEYRFDATAFESTEAFADYALSRGMKPDSNLWYDNTQRTWYSHPVITAAHAREFMERQMSANLASRGVIEPVYYLLGSDYRGESARYTLSYMSQMGGWAVLDYALHFSQDPQEYLRVGYASILSSWALMNTGTRGSNYGYWYPGPENDGAAGWAFEPQKYTRTWIRKEQGRGAWFYDGEIDLGYGGGLRAAATIVVDDSLFGRITYGGWSHEMADSMEVIPRDGVRQRLHIVRPGLRFHMLLDRDGYALERPILIKEDLSQIRFTLENRSGDGHKTSVQFLGLPAGQYHIVVDGIPVEVLSIAGLEACSVSVPVGRTGANSVVLLSRE